MKKGLPCGLLGPIPSSHNVLRERISALRFSDGGARRGEQNLYDMSSNGGVLDMSYTPLRPTISSTVADLPLTHYPSRARSSSTLAGIPPFHPHRPITAVLGSLPRQPSSSNNVQRANNPPDSPISPSRENRRLVHLTHSTTSMSWSLIGTTPTSSRLVSSIPPPLDGYQVTSLESYDQQLMGASSKLE